MRFSKQRRKAFSRVSKPPLPACSTRPSLTVLPEDVLHTIIAYIHASSFDSLRSVALVCSLFYFLAREFQRRELHVQCTVSNNSNVVALGERPKFKALLINVRRVVLALGTSGHAVRGSTSAEDAQSTVCKLLPLMSGLNALTHTGSRLPDRMLDVLDGMPHVKLLTEVKAAAIETADKEAETYLRRLSKSTRLHGLKCQIVYARYEALSTIMAALKNLLLCSTNLHHLALDIAHLEEYNSHYGAMGRFEQYCGLGFESGESMPALESLDIKNYPFGREAQKTGSTFDFNTKGYPGDGTEIDFWAREFDWSKLQCLQTAYPYLAIALSTQATALTEISVRDSESEPDLSLGCLRTGSLLESISVPVLLESSVANIIRHGATLRELIVHKPESSYRRWTGHETTPRLLATVQQHCPRLTEICIDAARIETWPYDVLDELAQFRNLKRIHLWFELGVTHPDKPVQPYLTKSSVTHIFEYILGARKLHGLEPIQMLKVHCGDDIDHGGRVGFPTMDAFWPIYNSSSFVCRLSERDDEASFGKFTVSSPIVDSREARERGFSDSQSRSPRQSFLRKWRHMTSALSSKAPGRGNKRGGQRSSYTTLLDEAKTVAVYGPKPAKEWNAHY